MREFTDKSNAPPLAKAQRFLEALSNKKDDRYFFGDGFPRLQDITNDAAAALEAWQAATSAQEARIRELEEALRDEKGILGKLARFADSCAEASFDGCDIDGGTIQEWMEGEGLLVRRPDLVVPCGEFCSCSESMGEGQQCDSLFLSAEFKQALSATARNDAHDWKLQGSAGVWESYYRCIKCGATVQENTDGPTKPETGCATAQEKQK